MSSSGFFYGPRRQKFVSMKGLSLVHGAVTAENIFFKKKNVPEFKLLDFSCAFFIDELPKHVPDLQKAGSAPELLAYAQARTSWERSRYTLDKLDYWNLGCLLFQLHFN